MDLIDTHCHLYFKQLESRLDQVVKDANEARVSRMICVGTSLSESAEAIKIAAGHQGIWASAGAHPHEAGEFLRDRTSQQKMAGLLSAPKVVAVGEIGLDFYRSETTKLDQEKAFRAQIEASLSAKLPYIFHVRDAWSDFWRIYDEYSPLKGVVHSFSSGTKQLKAALERDLYIGLNGIMTFTKDHAQLDAAKAVPLRKLVLETDAPFLAPGRFRGQVCEPKHVVITAEFLAELRGEHIEELSKATTDNAVKLFNLK
jgi:TatD DNase family protein